MAKPKRPAPKPRTTVPLTGTFAKQAAHLDSDAVLSIEYAQLWLQRHGSLKVHSSGVVRRALQVYMRHLSTVDGRGEVRATASACKAFTRPEEEHRLALLRLHAADLTEPLPSFAVIRDGARVVAERKAFHDRINQLLETE